MDDSVPTKGVGGRGARSPSRLPWIDGAPEREAERRAAVVLDDHARASADEADDADLSTAPARAEDGLEPGIGDMVDLPSLLILSATATSPKTVRDLAQELRLPIASLYRRVRALKSAGVLGAHKRKDNVTGKETMVYEGLVSGIQIRFTAREPVVELAFRDDEDEAR